MVMKFKCTKIEAPTNKFTIGKVYEAEFGFVKCDLGHETFISMSDPSFCIGYEERQFGKKAYKDWPLFAYFEQVE